MRRQTEIQLILERPHLYLPAILKAYGIQCETASTDRFSGRSIFRRENFIQCAEGWLPIVSAFAEGLDQHLGICGVERPQDQQSEVSPIVFIAGASTHDHRLYMHIETNMAADEAFGANIDAMKAMAASISGRYCEVCGSFACSREGEPVRCRVCKARGS